MKKILKKSLAILMCVVTIIAVIPSVSATNENSNVAYGEESDFLPNTNSALGMVINQAQQEQSGDSLEYSINYLEIEGTVAIAELVNVKACSLVVAIYSEDGQMLGSGINAVEPKETAEKTTEYVEIDIESMPGFFIAKAFLLNENNIALCKEYTCTLYTEAYQEFLAKTIYDFPENVVVNLDEQTDNNFAVLADGAISAEASETVNVLLSADHENGVYVFENADDSIRNLSKDDAFHFDTNDGEYIVIKVDDVDTDGNLTTVTATPEFEISDLFIYIKIDETASAAEGSIDDSVADEGIEYLGSYEETDAATTFSARAIEGTVKKEHEFAISKSDKSSDGTILKVEGGLKLSLEVHLKLSYDNDILDILFETTIKATYNLSISLEARSSFRLGIGRISVPVCPGVTIEGTPKFVISGKAIFEIENAIYVYKIGFSYNKNNGANPINTTESDWEPNTEAKIEIKMGLDFSLSGDLLYALKLTFSTEAGLKITCLMVTIQETNSKGEKHACSPCIDGDVDFYYKISAGVSVGLPFGINVDLIKKTFLEKTVGLFDFYISLGDKGLGFGFGECENYVKENSGHTHSLGNWQTTTKATCTKNGMRIKKCTTCGSTVKKETINKTGHTSSDWKTTLKPTCVKNGVKIKNCTTCKAVVSKETIPMNGHTAGEWKVTKEATCTETGMKIQKCKVCNIKLSEEIIPATGHLKRWEFTVNEENKESVGVANCAVCGEYLETQTGILVFSLSDDGESYIVSDCVTSVDGEIIIPSLFDGKLVTGIEFRAFYYCGNITSVTIPDSVTSIGNEAFYYCDDLTNIRIPNSVKNIGDYAFCHCTHLSSVSIGNDVASIGSGAFYNTEVYNDSSNWDEDILYIDNYLIKAGSSIDGSYSIVGSYSIKKGTKVIAASAFYNCDYLTNIEIPDTVIGIGNGAFEGCNGLTDVIIPDSVTNIGDGAFKNCDSLISISISDNATTMGESVFYDCDRLVSVIIPDSVIRIGGSAFYSCDLLESVKIGDGVTAIGEKTFYECKNLASVSIGSNVASIGLYAFYDCNRLISIAIPDSVTNIVNAAFLDCNRLESVIIGNGVKNIGSEAFGCCYVLANVYYTGTEEQWSAISIGSLNEKLTSANITYNYVIPESVTLSSSPNTAVLSGNAQTSETVYNAAEGYYYLIMAVKDKNASELLSNDNLLFIDQKTAEGSTLTFNVYIPESVTDYEIIITTNAPDTPSATPSEPEKPSTTEPVEESTTEPVETTNLSTTSPVEEPTTKPVEAPTTKPIEESTTKPVETEPSTTKPVEESTTKPVETTKPSTTKPVEETTTKLDVTEPSTTSHVEESTTKQAVTEPTTAEPTTTEPITKPVLLPSTSHVEEPTTKPVNKASVEIRRPSQTEISYGDSIILHAEIEGKLPEGAKIVWTADNANFTIVSYSADKTTCTVTPASSGDTVFTATVVDADGNEICSDTQTMTSKAGIFQKIIAFFKKLFGLTKIIPEVLKEML